jgi:hypothetical protein
MMKPIKQKKVIYEAFLGEQIGDALTEMYYNAGKKDAPECEMT